ncbi:ArsR/SmtB family transcription factor [Marinitoga aeolica]|jgi:DNA-binding transcriptional ArsR family regulator|uniref:Winged helix-turn-helix transcriptional regulator n=1 Tax=Marinitoga aeolica TaxID=2809031 RepID=A0ABY8PNW1_9BACT|nr:metalloregulator ArsR/SmtB family transcription factor [Marinitoga aeolica]WGS64324.1 winged helix-turn-helix transcriptional regulator [Marinitoga aeolica]
MSKKAEMTELKHDHDYYYDMAEFFSIFADPTRLKILHALLDGEKCVKKICQIVGLNQSTCSHQLKILRQYKVVKAKREGKFIRYSLDDSHIKDLIEVGEEHINE